MGGAKGKEAVQLLNVRFSRVSTHCDNVATHLTYKQEAKVGWKHTVHPNDGISK